MDFVKMEGTGNDFIIIEDIERKLEQHQSELAKKICDRNFGIGADGILFVRKKENIFEMVIINSDGSYAEMCGNGLRCFARYIKNKFNMEDKFEILTGDGIKKIEIKENNLVKIDMGKPDFKPNNFSDLFNQEVISKEIIIKGKNYSVTSMILGVPHTVIFGKLDNFNINEDGSNIEKSNYYKNGTNVNFSEINDIHNVKVKTFERGAGKTLACGTGCCSVAVAGIKEKKLQSPVRIKTDGGELIIEIKGDNVFMTAPANEVFTGKFHMIL